MTLTKIKPEIVTVLSRAEVEGNKLVLSGMLDRPTYVAANKVIEAIGGKWNKKEKAHVFPEDAEDVVQQVIMTGAYTDEKQLYQFFPTSDDLAKELVQLANIQPGDTVLEPSAGQGNILRHLPSTAYCYELNPAMKDALQTAGFNVLGSDFLECDQEFDVIVANPPFTKQQDIIHITKMIELARKTVVSVASAGVLFRTDKRTTAFRELVESYGGTIEELPENSFKAAGTSVRTVLVHVTK